ncbi:MAG: WbqC family protein [Nitrospina sp.]|nr:WbqC family protein [Nitrospina sp.]
MGTVYLDERTLGLVIQPTGIETMRVTILQPSYLPWLGFFDQMDRSDQFVLYDDVQFTRRDWRNRNKVRIREGSVWLTVPVIQKNKFEQSLLETKIDNSTSWKRKHLETIRCHYSKAPFFDLYFPWCEKIFNSEWEFLLDLSLETIEYLREQLKIDTPLLRSSELGGVGNKTQRLISICKQLGATQYLSGEAAKDYISEKEFADEGIELGYQEYQHPEYQQRYAGFIPFMSTLDLLFNCGEKSLGILKQTESSCT